MAVTSAVHVPGSNPQPLFSVTQGANAATFTVSGISGDSGLIYRVDFALICSSNATMSCLFNGNAASHQSYRSDYSTGAAFGSQGNFNGMGFVHGVTPQSYVAGSLRLWPKTGAVRLVRSDFVSRSTAPESGVVRGHASWTDTATVLTSIAITVDTGTINANSYVRVYADGVY